MSSSRRFLVYQALVLGFATAAMAVLAPRLLMIERGVLGNVLLSLALTAGAALALATAAAALHLRRHRYLLRALAMGSHGLETEDLGGLAELATALAVRFFVLSGAVFAAWMLPGLRPAGLDGGRATALGLLCLTILGAAAIPYYVLARRATMKLVETAPLGPITQLLEQAEKVGEPEARVQRKMLLAVVAPVALVGTGAVLIAHAHVRNLVETSARETAALVARTALEPTPGPLPEAGREEAAAAAKTLGFDARIERASADPNGEDAEQKSQASPREPLAFRRETDGSLAARVPLEDGVAIVRFAPTLPSGGAPAGVVIALAAVLGAALVGSLFGRALARDLVLATRRLRGLGTETVLRGDATLEEAARFDAVRALGRAVDTLASRFRVFAAAQERAIEARAAALRMRGLLFASVSHDLKSPLNAILGFAELVGREPLAPEQRESLELITSRGRELLALIETILDAARVEAGQLTLAPRLVPMPVLLREAATKARELATGAAAEIDLRVEGDPPAVPLDPTYGTRAVAVVIAHAMRLATAASPPVKSPIRVRAVMPSAHDAPPDAVHLKPRMPINAPMLVEVAMPPTSTDPAELEALFARQVTSRGRGLTLGLSLARSVIELHGGAVEVASTNDDLPVVRFWLALALPERRPRLSSMPALGVG